MLYYELRCIEEPGSSDDLNEAAYWAVNPDARQGGFSAVEHFTRFGQQEGRKQAANTDQVSALREAKLSRLRLRRPPNPGRSFGEPMNFLTDDVIREFQIPRDPPVSSHSYEGFSDMLRENPDKLFLDIGAGLRSSVSSNMIDVDIYPSVSTDVVCVGEDLPFESNQFDFVICAAVLEHTRRPWDVAREICRVLKPGGTARVDYPFIAVVHGYPNHYFNATPEGAISLFEPFCDIQSSSIESNGHPIHAIWWFLAAWRYGLPGADRASFEALTVGDFLARSPDAHMDAPFCRNLSAEAQRITAAGSTLVAIKKQDPAVTSDRSIQAQFPTESDLLAENMALKRDLQLLRSSRSWTWTAPIRAAVTALRRSARDRRG